MNILVAQQLADVLAYWFYLQVIYTTMNHFDCVILL